MHGSSLPSGKSCLSHSCVSSVLFGRHLRTQCGNYLAFTYVINMFYHSRDQCVNQEAGPATWAETVGIIEHLHLKTVVFDRQCFCFYIVYWHPTIFYILNEVHLNPLWEDLVKYPKWLWRKFCLLIQVSLNLFDRYAFSSEDASEDFDGEDSLTLIKPSSLPSKDVMRPSELRSAESSKGLLPQGDNEEDKTLWSGKITVMVPLVRLIRQHGTILRKKNEKFFCSNTVQLRSSNAYQTRLCIVTVFR